MSVLKTISEVFNSIFNGNSEEAVMSSIKKKGLTALKAHLQNKKYALIVAEDELINAENKVYTSLVNEGKKDFEMDSYVSNYFKRLDEKDGTQEKVDSLKRDIEALEEGIKFFIEEKQE